MSMPSTKWTKLRRLNLESLETRRLLCGEEGSVDRVDVPGPDACVLTFGEQGSGEALGDADVLAFDAVAGEYYRIEFTAFAGGSYQLTDEANQVFVEAAHSSDTVTWKAHATQRFYLSVDRARGYGITVLDEPGNRWQTANSLSLPSVLREKMDTPDDVDWYEFTISEGQAIVVEEAEGLEVTVFNDSASEELAHRGFDEEHLVYVSPEDSTLRLRVRSPNGYDGSYTLSLASEEPTLFDVLSQPGDRELDLGVPNSIVPLETPGAIDEAGETDRYSFRAIPGSHFYELEVDLGTLTDSVMRLYDRDTGELLAENDDAENSLGSKLLWQTDRERVVDVVVEGLNATGTFDLILQLVADDHFDTDDQATPLNDAATITGTLDYPFDRDRFYIDALAGDVYHVEGTFDPTIAVTLPNGETFSGTDRSWTAPANGRYFFVVGSNLPILGPYAFAFQRIEDDFPNSPLPDGPAVSLDSQPVSGVLEAGNDRDVFAFNVDVPDTVITARGSSGELLAAILLQDGTRLRGSEQQLRPRSTWSIAAPGVYYLEIAHRSPSDQLRDFDYEFRLAADPDDYPDSVFAGPHPQLVLGDAIAGSNESERDRDVFALEGTAGQDVLLEATSNASLLLMDGQGRRIAEGTGQISQRLPFTGQYFISLSNAGRSYGLSGKLVVDETENDGLQHALPLELGVPVSGVVANPDDEDWFLFTVTEGSLLEIDSNPRRLLQIEIVDLDGERLFFGKDQFNISEPGQYAMILRSRFQLEYEITLEATPDEVPSSVEDTPPLLSVDTQVQGDLGSPTDIDVYAIDLPQVPIVLSATWLSRSDAELRLRRSDGPFSVAQKGSKATWPIDEPGRYYLQVSSTGEWSGQYSFELQTSEDAPANAEQVGEDAPKFSINSVLRGSVDFRWDRDAWPLMVSAGQAFDLVVSTGPAYVESHFQLFASDKQTLLHQSDGPRLSWKPERTETLYVVISGLQGPYELSFLPTVQPDPEPDTRESAQPLPFAESMVGRINVPNDRDVWKFEDVQAGQVFHASTSLLTWQDSNETLTLRFLDAQGNVVASSTDARGVELSYQATDSGTLYFEITSTNYFGRYETEIISTLDDHANSVSPQATVLESDEIAQGIMEYELDRDVFRWDAAVDEIFQFQLSSDSVWLLNIYDANGTELAQSEIARLRWQAPTAGTYFIAVSTNRSAFEVPYQLTMTRTFDEVSNRFEDAKVIELGTTIAGAIEINNDVDVYQFTGESGTEYLVGVSGAEVSLIDSRNILQAGRRWTATDQPLYVEVSGDVGDYWLQVSAVMANPTDDHPDIPSADVVILSPGASASFSFDYEGDRDVFAFQTGADETWSFDMKDLSGSHVDWRVLDAEGGVVADCRDRCFFTEFYIPQAGTHYLELASRTSIKDFEITLQVIANDVHPNRLDAERFRTVEPGGRYETRRDTVNDRDIFALEARTNYVYAVEGGWPAEAVYAPSGDRIPLDSDNAFKATQTGRHLLVMAPTTIFYQFTIAEWSEDLIADIAGPETPLLGLLEPTTGRIDLAGDLDVYSFDVVEGQQYDFELQRVSREVANLGIRILGPNGQSLASVQGGRMTWQAPSSGRSYIEISGDAPAEFSLSVSLSQDTIPNGPGVSAPTLTVNSQISAELEYANDVDVFATSTLDPGQYELHVQRKSLASNSQLDILDGQGNVVASGLGSRLSWRTEDGGTYYVSVTGTIPVGYDIEIRSIEVPAVLLDSSADIAEASPTNASAIDKIAVSSPLLGDIDGNRSVDFVDFLLLSGEFGKAGNLRSDLDANGTVDFADFLLLSSKFGQSDQHSRDVAAVGDHDPVVLNVDETIEIPSGTSEYEFTAVGGVHYVSVTACCHTRILDTSEQLLAEISADASWEQRIWKAPASGSYRLELSNSQTEAASVQLMDLSDSNQSPASAVPIVGDSVLDGRLEHPADVDWFRIDGLAGERVQLEWDRPGSQAYRIRLYEADGITKIGDGYWNSIQEIEFASEGTKYVSVYANGRDPGSYRLWARRHPAQLINQLPQPGDESHALGVPLGAKPTTAVVELTSERQLATPTFRATAGDHLYVIEAIPGTVADPQIRLLDDQGNVLAEDDDSGTGWGSRITWRARTAGVYHVEVTGHQQVGDLTVNISVWENQFPSAIGGPNSHAANVPHVGHIDFPGEPEVIAFDLEPNTFYELDAMMGDWAAFSRIRLLNADGRRILDTSLSWSRQGVYVGTDTRHYVEFTSQNSAPVFAEFNEVPDVYPDTIAEATVIQPNQVIHGRLHTRDTDAFAFDVEANQGYELTLPSHTSAVLYSQNGTRVDLPWINTRWKSRSSGRYYLELYGSQEYELLWSTVDDDHPDEPSDSLSELTLGATTTFHFETTNDVDFFQVAGQTGRLHELTVSAPGDVQVYAPDGTVLAERFGDQPIVWRSVSNEPHFVSFAGSFTFPIEATVQEIEDDHPDQPGVDARLINALGVPGRIESFNDRDFFAFDAATDTTLEFQLTDTNESWRLKVRDQDGFLLAALAADRSWTADSAGRYYLEVSSAGALGTYAIGVIDPNQPDPDPDPVDPNPDDHPDTIPTTTLEKGQAVAGIIDNRRDTDAFRIQLDGEQLLEVTIEGELASTNPHLNSPDAFVIWTNSNRFIVAPQGEQEVTIYVTTGSNRNNLPYTVSHQATSDDHADAIGPAATPVTLGEPTRGAFELLGDVDVFTFEAEAGQRFEMTGWPQGNVKIGRPGQLEQSGPQESYRYWVAPEDGTYFLVLEETIGERRYYKFTWTLLAFDDHADTRDSNATPLNAFIPQGGSLEYRHDIDVFSFEVEAGQNFEIQLQARVVNSFQLYREEELLFDIRPDGSLNLTWNATESGTYFVRLGQRSYQGQYDVTYSPIADDHPFAPHGDATWLIPGEVALGTSEVSQDLDVFRLEALTEIYEFQLSSNYPSFRAQLDLLDATGELILEGLNHGDRWDSRSARTVFVRVRPSSPGPYSLTVVPRSDDWPNTIGADAPLLTLDEPIEGRLESEIDEDVFAFDARAGEGFSFQAMLDEQPFDLPRVQFYDANGALLDDRSGTASWRARTDGRYYVSVSANDIIADYTGILSSVPNDDHPDFVSDSVDMLLLVDGAEVDGVIDVSNDVDVFRLELQPSDTVVINVTRFRPYPDIELLSANGQVIASGNSYLGHRVESGGTYFLRVSGSPTEYQIALAVVPDDFPDSISDPPRLVEYGDTVQGHFEVLGDIDVLAFDATAGDRIEIHFDGRCCDQDDARLFDANGQEIVRFPVSPFRVSYFWLVPESGRYFVRVANERGGNYTFQLFDKVKDDFPDRIEDVDVTTLLEPNVDQIVQVEVNGDVDLLPFAAVRGEAVQITVGNRWNAVGIQVLSENGDVLSSGQSAMSWIPRDTGVFYLRVTGTVDAYLAKIAPIADDHPDYQDALLALANDRIDGLLEIPGDRDLFGIELESGQSLSLDFLSGVHPTPQVRVRNADGTVLPETNGRWSIAETGEYAIEVTGSRRGTYRFEVRVE